LNNKDIPEMHFVAFVEIEVPFAHYLVEIVNPWFFAHILPSAKPSMIH
jgi:hypothetical protein